MNERQIKQFENALLYVVLEEVTGVCLGPTQEYHNAKYLKARGVLLGEKRNTKWLDDLQSNVKRIVRRFWLGRDITNYPPEWPIGVVQLGNLGRSAQKGRHTERTLTDADRAKAL